MSYTADSIRDSIRIRLVTPGSIRIRFERKRPIRRSLVIQTYIYIIPEDFYASMHCMCVMRLICASNSFVWAQLNEQAGIGTYIIICSSNELLQYRQRKGASMNVRSKRPQRLTGKTSSNHQKRPRGKMATKFDRTLTCYSHTQTERQTNRKMVISTTRAKVSVAMRRCIACMRCSLFVRQTHFNLKSIRTPTSHFSGKKHQSVSHAGIGSEIILCSSNELWQY